VTRTACHRTQRSLRAPRIAAILIVGYILSCAAVVYYERQITYQPNPRPVVPAEQGLTGVTSRTLSTPDGERLVVWRIEAKPGRPTILYFHGNGDTLAERADRIRQFQVEGYGLFMLAWRGFSGSTGTPSEPALVADASLAYETLRSEGVAAADIVIYGESLGTHIATRTALTHPARALILEAPFTSMVDAWRQFAPILPVGMLLRDRFDTLAVIGDLRMPLLVLHGERDRLVGHQLGRRVFAAAPHPKRFASSPEAGHTNLYAHDAIKAVRRFLADVAAGSLR
jgi:hypothetical protein